MIGPRRAATGVILVLVLLLAGCEGGGRVRAGPAVGFESAWVLDPARTYRTAFDDGETYGASKSPRPVLMNVWYPAMGGGPRMTHREYLRIDPEDPSMARLAQKLTEYEQEVIAQELVGSAPGKASDEGRRALERAMERVTPNVRGAAAAPGRHPLVIYHGGAGSSFEDNALLCEELAADGFVVIGGAFLAADGASFNIDAENAGREIEFLVRMAAGMENVDASRVGLVGHSAGAQGALVYAARPGIAVDAIVSLDTTQDYRTLADPRWPLLVGSVERGRQNYSTPTMFVAGPTAIFALGDTLTRSERVYLTVPGLSHNEYISQGENAAALSAEWKPDPDGRLGARAERVARQGTELRSLVSLYLRAKLRQDPEAWARLRSLEGDTPSSGASAELMAVGAAGPRKQAGAPTPRSVYLAYVLDGSRGAIAEMNRAERLDPELFDDGFVFQLLYDLTTGEKPAEVLSLFEFFLSRGVDVRPFLVAQADLFASINRYPEFVEVCVRMGRVVAKGDAATETMVRKYEAKR